MKGLLFDIRKAKRIDTIALSLLCAFFKRLWSFTNKIFLLLFFTPPIFSFDLIAQTSIYHPFPDSNAYWRVDYNENPPFQCTGTNGLIASYQYAYEGDTLINGFIYKKINKTGIIYFSWCYPGTPLGYQGAFREDTVAKKAYLVLPGATADSLLYDFSLQIGDTVKTVLHQMSVFASSCTDYIVTSIDSQLIGSTYRKKWFISGNPSGCLAGYVEGMGNLYGFLDSYYYFEQGANLCCFTIDSTPQYLSTCFNINVCAPVNVAEGLLFKQIDIHPNPVIENTFSLSVAPMLGESISEIEFYDSQGINYKLNWIKLKNSILFYDNSLSKGIYLLRINFKGDNYSIVKVAIIK